jgi:hypothetical protein
MEKWEIRARLVESKGLADVLRSIRDCPGLSASKLIRNLKYAGATVKRRVIELDSLKLIRVEGERTQSCGKPNRHYITDLGIAMLGEVEKIPNPAAFVRIVYSDKYLEKLGDKNAVEIQRIFGDPRIKNAISVLVSELIFVVLEKEAGCAITSLEGYDDRFYFIGDFSEENSQTIKYLVEREVFSDETLALKHVIVVGMQLMKDLRRKVEKDSELFFAGKSVVPSLKAFKFNPESSTLKPVRGKLTQISKKKYLLEFP